MKAVKRLRISWLGMVTIACLGVLIAVGLLQTKPEVFMAIGDCVPEFECEPLNVRMRCYCMPPFPTPTPPPPAKGIGLTHGHCEADSNDEEDTDQPRTDAQLEAGGIRRI